MAECARVAKDVVFVAADDSQAVITAEMRESPRRSIYWPTGRDDEASAPSAVADAKAPGFWRQSDAADRNMRAQGRIEWWNEDREIVLETCAPLIEAESR
jgi:hypothetical protein